MNYFVDTEFNQSGTRVELISIGIVAEDGREYYAQNQDCDLSLSNEFVRERVIPLLDNTSWKDIRVIRQEVTAFTDDNESRSVFWAYFGSYDWVAICGTIFGDMTAAPDGFPFSSFDINQYAYHLGIREIKTPKPKDNHNALVDARWNKESYEWLRNSEKLKTNKKVINRKALV